MALTVMPVAAPFERGDPGERHDGGLRGGVGALVGAPGLGGHVARLMILPPPPSSIQAEARCMVTSMARTLIAKTVSHSAIEVSESGPFLSTPALFTRMSTPPSRSIAASMARRGVIRVGEVGVQIVAADALGDLDAAVVEPIEDRDPGALGGEPAGDVRADPTGAPGDDGAQTFESRGRHRECRHGASVPVILMRVLRVLHVLRETADRLLEADRIVDELVGVDVVDGESGSRSRLRHP